MPITQKILACSLAISAALSGSAFAEDITEGRRLAKLAFASVDGDDRGYIDQGQFRSFGGDVFYSMDADENDLLSLGEFLAWDYGMAPLAEEMGRKDAYETALRVVFAFWDRNGDGNIAPREHLLSLGADFKRADADGDALLTEDEFTGGFSVMVALRAAIAPVPVE